MLVSKYKVLIKRFDKRFSVIESPELKVIRIQTTSFIACAFENLHTRYILYLGIVFKQIIEHSYIDDIALLWTIL